MTDHMRDDNGQQQLEHKEAQQLEEQYWHEKTRALIDEIHEVVEKEIKGPENV